MSTVAPGGTLSHGNSPWERGHGEKPGGPWGLQQELGTRSSVVGPGTEVPSQLTRGS